MKIVALITLIAILIRACKREDEQEATPEEAVPALPTHTLEVLDYHLTQVKEWPYDTSVVVALHSDPGCAKVTVHLPHAKTAIIQVNDHNKLLDYVQQYLEALGWTDMDRQPNSLVGKKPPKIESVARTSRAA